MFHIYIFITLTDIVAKEAKHQSFGHQATPTFIRCGAGCVNGTERMISPPLSKRYQSAVVPLRVFHFSSLQEPAPTSVDSCLVSKLGSALIVVVQIDALPTIINHTHKQYICNTIMQIFYSSLKAMHVSCLQLVIVLSFFQR